MTTIAHLIDDSAVGGVTRMVADQARCLGSRFSPKTYWVNPRRPLPPRVTEDIAVLHFTVSTSKLPFMTLLRAQRGNQPIMLIEHSYTRAFEEQCVPNRTRFRRMLRLAYRLVDVVVAVSHGQAAWMRDAGVVPAEKLVVIQSSLECAGLEALPVANRIEGTPLRLAAYGRYCRQKGFDTLLEAMRMLPPGAATLTVAGYGPDLESLQQIAAAIPGVQVGGAVQDLPGFLSGCDAVIVPSRWEAFGLVGLEARKAGRPLIVSGVDGLFEQVTPTTGVVAGAAEAFQLAAAIIELAGRDLEPMGLAARATVTDHFEDNLRAWTGLFARIGQRSGAGQMVEIAA